MKCISSNNIIFSKKIFPIVWFGFLAFSVVQSISSGAYKESVMPIVIPCIMAVFGFFLMKALVWDLVDQVFDCGDYLLIKGRGIEEKVPLTNIMNVSASMNTNPSRITLRLISPNKFGREIAFSPVTGFTLNPFAKSVIAEDLIVRVDHARQKRAP